MFNWVVKQGNIVLSADNNKIHLEINKEDHSTCLLTKTDAEEVIDILTGIAEKIWNNAEYTKEPYTGKLYTINDNGKAFWDINETRLIIGLNDQQDALEMNFQGNAVIKLSVNLAIEIVQIITHFANKL